MKIKLFINHILKKYQLSEQESWDESGLITFYDKGQDVTSCIVCLDLTNNVIDEALRQNAQVIISHHPIFQKNPDHPLNQKQKTIFKRLHDNQISWLCLHTCYDNNKNGMNTVLAQKLGFKSFKWFNDDIKAQFILINLSSYLSVKQITALFNEKIKYCQNFLTNVNNSAKFFNSIAICAGSGYDILSKSFEMKDMSKTLFITGDIKYHDWVTINEFGLSFLDIGHEVENIFVDDIEQYLHKKFHSIKITKIYSDVKKYVI